MIERANCFHPDKIADRIAGAIVDLAYTKSENPKVACEVLIGHGECNIIIESSEKFTQKQIEKIVHRISNPETVVNLKVAPQDPHLAHNQAEEVRCGDNGIFKGVPLTNEEITLSRIAREITEKYPYDGKYIYDKDESKLIICQSNISEDEANSLITHFKLTEGIRNIIVNPLGPWTGGIDVDSGATNRKLGSDMAQSVTGGGLFGKDISSKADVCCNIWAFVKAQETNKIVTLNCAIGDTEVTGKIGNKKIKIPYKEIADFARDYIKGLGGLEAFAEWGLY